jgi:two-component system phosphate regulon sensor histidine kinase PhoR
MFLSRAEMELRMPLSLIQGYLETLKTGAFRNGDTLGRCLEVMEKHSRRLMHVIEEINAVSQLGAGGSPTRCDDVFLRRCLEIALERLSPPIDVSGAVIESHIPPGSCQLKGDRMVWHLVFTKLLEEILRGLPPKSRITLSASWETCGCQLEVSSDAAIITRGVPAPGETDWNEAALGLLVVKRAMELNHGSLEWRMEPGSGFTFILSMPCDKYCSSTHGPNS